MADWNLPLLTSLYVDFLALLKGRDEDAITLCKVPVVNPVVGTVRYERTTNLFQEWSGTAWVNLVIAIGSGGLGASTPPAARAALGIGTMGIQDANNVAITGGTIANLGSLGVNGNADIGGTLELGSANNVVSDPTGLLIATKLTGVVPPVNLGTGVADINKVLRGNGTWGDIGMLKSIQYLDARAALAGGTFVEFNLSSPVTDFTKCEINMINFISTGDSTLILYIRLISNTTLRVQFDVPGESLVIIHAQILEHKAIG